MSAASSGERVALDELRVAHAVFVEGVAALDVDVGDFTAEPVSFVKDAHPFFLEGGKCRL